MQLFLGELTLTTKTTIRTEQPPDYRTVETIHRNAFWNLYVPGADEHYIAHILRDHADFIPELDLVITLSGQIIGNIMYTKSKLVTATGLEKPIVTSVQADFGTGMRENVPNAAPIASAIFTL